MRALIFSFLLCSCVANQGGIYGEFLTSTQKVFDCSNSALLDFNNNAVSVTNSFCQLKENYTQLDSLEDNDYTTEWSYHNFTADPIDDVFTEGSSQMQFACNGSEEGLRFDNNIQTDYLFYTETTLNSGSTLTMTGRASGGAGAYNYYMFLTNGTNHILLLSNNGFTSNISQIATTVVPSAGNTYAQKIKFDGADISYKVWNKANPEPAAWTMTVNNATHAAGDIALSCRSESGYFQNLRTYDLDADTDYELTNETVEFNNFEFEGELFEWLGFSATLDVNGTDQVKFDISSDNGATYYSYFGGSWQVNAAGYTNAMTASELNSAISSFDTNIEQIKIRAYLHSADGSTTPKINKINLMYSEKPF